MVMRGPELQDSDPRRRRGAFNSEAVINTGQYPPGARGEGWEKQVHGNQKRGWAVSAHRRRMGGVQAGAIASMPRPPMGAGGWCSGQGMVSDRGGSRRGTRGKD